MASPRSRSPFAKAGCGLRITDTTRQSHDEWWTQPRLRLILAPGGGQAIRIRPAN
jgi:hypothetical protein